MHMAVILTVDGQGTLSILQSDGFQSLNNDVVMDESVHLCHRRSNLFRSSPGGAVILAILLSRALRLGRFGVLCGDEDGVDLCGNDGSVGKLIVGDSDLSLSVRAKPPEGSVLTHISELLSKLVRKEMRQRHVTFGLIRSVSKHDTLVTSTNIHVILSNVDTSSNIGRLLVDADEHLASITGETLGINRRKIINEGAESDLLDLITDDLLVVEVGCGRDLTEDHHHVILGGGFTGDLGHGVGLEACIKDGVGDLIAELVGVALVDRLRGEKEGACFNHD
mmetsp:Transcript_22094/g.33597  ORF Transcript_22094/g.33597 Transcript_22094/m.33597 type:complete len:279 (+) Transcript_22094:680-1516(+)